MSKPLDKSIKHIKNIGNDQLTEELSSYGVEFEEQKTIKEWEEEYGLKIVDPDGFDRSDKDLHNRKFTKAEFEKGLMSSSIIGNKKKSPLMRAFDVLLGEQDE